MKNSARLAIRTRSFEDLGWGYLILYPDAGMEVNAVACSLRFDPTVMEFVEMELGDKQIVQSPFNTNFADAGVLRGLWGRNANSGWFAPTCVATFTFKMLNDADIAQAGLHIIEDKAEVLDLNNSGIRAGYPSASTILAEPIELTILD